MNTQLSGPKHVRADVGRAHRGRSLLAAAAASLVALTGLSGIALASDEDETPTPSTPASSSQIGATEGAPSDETRPTGDAGTISSGTAGHSSATPEESAPVDDPSATADPEVHAASESEPKSPSKAPTSIQTRDAEITPLSAGPDGPAGQALPTPYLYWRAVNQSGLPIGGASFTISGPRYSSSGGGANGNWPNSTVVVDNTGQQGYSGLDLDADPGEFAIAYLTGDVRIQATRNANRYRIQRTSPPSGYQLGSTTWTTMTQSGQNSNNAEWSSDSGPRSTWTNSFGDFTFAPTPTGTPLSCAPGTVYALASDGLVRSVVEGLNPPSSTSLDTVVQSIDPSWGDMNGLGISADGSVAYAFNRFGSRVLSIYRYAPGQGATSWSSIPSTAIETQNNLVAGAVNQANGHYFFGGFYTSSDHTYFELYEYNPFVTTDSIRRLGTFDTGRGTGSNGDMAFDVAGNLYIVRAGNKANIYTVTAANLAAASGGTITAQSTEPKDVGLTAVNGIAFAADGTAYLGNTSAVGRYNPSTWGSIKSVTTNIGASGSGSYDLASCASPSTLTLQKNVAARVASTDQFRLAVQAGSTSDAAEVANVTTAGTNLGLQSQQVGPIPAVAGSTYRFSEGVADTTVLLNYSSSWSCTSNDVALASGTGTWGTVQIPAPSSTGGADVECVFTNSPLVANVAINKLLLNADGTSGGPGVNWTVGAEVNATTGSATANPTKRTQNTDSSGSANWAVNFGSSSARATVTVSETQQTGYRFVSGSCVITDLNGVEQLVVLGEQATALTAIAPGDQVSCTYTNQKVPTTLTLQKSVDNTNGGSASPSDWTLTAQQGTSTPVISESPSVVVGSDASATTKTATVVAGVPYTLTESGSATSYVAGSWTCMAAGGTPPTVASSAGATTVTVAVGTAVTCSITNTYTPGSVTWSKTDSSSPANLLAGSVWTLTGPGAGTDGTKVVDCTQPTCDSGMFKDQDPAAGQFRLTGLSWGSYSLTEATPPVGYVRDSSSHPFTVDAADLAVSLGSIKNSQVSPPSLPLTGGLGTDTFLLAGGGLLALAGIGGWIHRRRSLRVQRA